MQHDRVLAKVREHAYSTLTAENRQTTNLHIDEQIRSKGEKLGPDLQKIEVDKPSILVFADDQPLANFGHACRYLLYDAETAAFRREIPARFPPFRLKPPLTLKPFHEPVKFVPSDYFHLPPIVRCPMIRPDGARYAILYSGMSNMRHLNDLEFAYRTLIDVYGFHKDHIYVLNYDGTRNTQDGAATVWPGDGTAYRIQVTGQGTRACFQDAFNDLKKKLKPHDSLFIHTNNHGDNNGVQSYLCEFPNWGTYLASEFCADLGVLPKYRSLMVMMEQCNAGGFNLPVIAASTADNTSVASAAIASQSSYASPDGHWDSFARDWIAAQSGHDPYGAALAFNPDTNLDGAIEATEAFNYANAIHYSGDSPNYNQSSVAAGQVTLNQKYTFWWHWCLLLAPEIDKYRPPFPNPPDPEFYEKVLAASAELQSTLLPAFDRAAVELRHQLAPKITAAFEKQFGKAREAGAA